MEASSFWLISIEEFKVSVSLVLFSNNRFSIISIGPRTSWNPNSEDSLNLSIDESLSNAAASANIAESEEPGLAAFVLPPFWVGADGRIVSGKLKLIENVCRGLNLKPTGFIADDEAIVEEANLKDGFPSSFILIHLGEQEFTLSLIYLGKVKERIRKIYDGKFNPQLIESALVELDSDSTLPPQIIIFGETDISVLNEIKTYPWVGKKNLETFLHLPDVKLHTNEDIINIYTKTITSQFKTCEPVNNISVPVDTMEDTEEIEEKTEIINDESNEEIETPKPKINLEEVDASELGFTSEPETNQPDFPVNDINIEPSIEPQIEPSLLPILNAANFKLPSAFSLKKIPKVPKIPKIKLGRSSLFLFAAFPLLILIPLLFSTAKVTLFVTPYVFSKQLPIILDSTTNDIDINRGIIPVEKKTFDVTTSTSIPTTGQKTVGDKAKGEIIVYNKVDKTQNLPKGTVLIDPSNRKYELVNEVSVASSSSNLDEGVINLGQTRTVISALDIGEEYNIGKDIKLKFKDFPETSLIAKVKDPFTGGSKRQISAVSSDDKKNLATSINQSMNEATNNKIDKDLSDTAGIIKETIQTQKPRIEYSREVDEEANELSATAESSVSVFVLNDNRKDQIINEVLSKEADFNQAIIDPQKFNLKFQITKNETDSSTGNLIIEGNALPKIDLVALAKSISGKSQSKANQIIKKTVNRVYNFNIKTNLPFIKAINPLPFQAKNINFEIKTESL